MDRNRRGGYINSNDPQNTDSEASSEEEFSDDDDLPEEPKWQQLVKF
jgi:hypothetical protein